MNPGVGFCAIIRARSAKASEDPRAPHGPGPNEWAESAAEPLHRRQEHLDIALPAVGL